MDAPEERKGETANAPPGGKAPETHAALFRGIRAQSAGALRQFEQLLPLDGMPAVMVVRKALKAGDPVEIACISNLVIELGLSYTQPYGKLPGQRKQA